MNQRGRRWFAATVGRTFRSLTTIATNSAAQRRAAALAVEAGKGIEEPGDRTRALSRAAVVQAEAGDVVGARQTIALILDAAAHRGRI